MPNPPRHLIIADGAFGPGISKPANSAIGYPPEQVVGVLDRAPARTRKVRA